MRLFRAPNSSVGANLGVRASPAGGQGGRFKSCQPRSVSRDQVAASVGSRVTTFADVLMVLASGTRSSRWGPFGGPARLIANAERAAGDDPAECALLANALVTIARLHAGGALEIHGRWPPGGSSSVAAWSSRSRTSQGVTCRSVTSGVAWTVRLVPKRTSRCDFATPVHPALAAVIVVALM